jgi:DNA end-binding protein Ku
MRTIWKGAINFGLINVPIKLSAATQKEDVAFRMLHKKCRQPLNQKRWCAKCGKEVPFTDTVKGFEYEKGKFVIIDEKDLERLPVKSAKYIQIVDFISLKEIDPVFYEKSYYLTPEAAGEKAFIILRDAMKGADKVAVGKITIREKEHLCVIRAYEKILCMETMFFADEVRSAEPGEMEKIEKKHKIGDAEKEMAAKLLENLTAKFEPEKYHDEYRAELKKLIQAKIDGDEIIIAAPAADDNPKVIDLMERLRQSVEATKRKRA